MRLTCIHVHVYQPLSDIKDINLYSLISTCTISTVAEFGRVRARNRAMSLKIGCLRECVEVLVLNQYTYGTDTCKIRKPVDVLP